MKANVPRKSSCPAFRFVVTLICSEISFKLKLKTRVLAKLPLKKHRFTKFGLKPNCSDELGLQTKIQF